jgi:primosomal protein N' (replication factor Y)
VVVDVSLEHLDRLFDYAVPASLADRVQPGVRVRVRFGGKDVDAFVVERVGRTDFSGTLTPLLRVVSDERVLTPEVLRLTRAVADRYAGTLPDTLRLAIPARHARTEAAQSPPIAAVPPRPDPGPWRQYPAGEAFLDRLGDGRAPRAVWSALPGAQWARCLAVAAGTALSTGRGVLAVLPDRRDLDVLERVIIEELGPGLHLRLEAESGPAQRYRTYLSALRGRARFVVGTRAAAWAPVADLGLLMIWDDGDDLHAEPRAPYPHMRDVLATRAEQGGAAFLAGGWSHTAETARWLESGWARRIEPERSLQRRRWPRVDVAGTAYGDADSAAASARIPPAAFRALRDGLRAGSVLVQVPRAGYVPGLSCARCRSTAVCTHCSGPLRLGGPGGDRSPSCERCGRTETRWSCPKCGHERLRASAVGVDRTAEEFGRAFPGATLIVSRAGSPLPEVPGRGAVVLSTPGIEPYAPSPGYAAAVLLDGDLLVARADLRASEDALRRWRAAAALVRPATEGGSVVICADPQLAPVQALVRGDPLGYAARELSERVGLGLPPAVTMAAITADPATVTGFVESLDLPEGTETLGPVPVERPARASRVRRAATARGRAGAGEGDPATERTVARILLRVPRSLSGELAEAVRAGLALRRTRREPGTVRVEMDPRHLA